MRFREGVTTLTAKNKTKSMHFDMTDELEKSLLDYAESKKNFSRYIKRLILADMVTDGEVENMQIVRKINKEKKYDPKDFEFEL